MKISKDGLECVIPRRGHLSLSGEWPTDGRRQSHPLPGRTNFGTNTHVAQPSTSTFPVHLPRYILRGKQPFVQDHYTSHTLQRHWVWIHGDASARGLGSLSPQAAHSYSNPDSAYSHRPSSPALIAQGCHRQRRDCLSSSAIFPGTAGEHWLLATGLCRSSMGCAICQRLFRCKRA